MTTEIRNLRCLVALARRLNFSRAADDLGISQPSLTRTIQALEQRLGLRLFDRDRSGVRPTAQGRSIIDRAAALLIDFDDFERQARLAATGEAGILRVGMAPLPARALLPAALAERLQAMPHLVNEVLVRNVEVLWPLLIADEIEFLIAAEGQEPDNANIRGESLGHFPASLLVRRNHPLLEGVCAGQKFPILLASRRGLGRELPQSLKESVWHELQVIEDYQAITDLIQRCDAIWWSSAYASVAEVQNGTFRILPQSDEFLDNKFRMMLYTLERRSLSPAARMFKEALQRRMRRLEAQFDNGVND